MCCVSVAAKDMAWLEVHVLCVFQQKIWGVLKSVYKCISEQMWHVLNSMCCVSVAANDVGFLVVHVCYGFT